MKQMTFFRQFGTHLYSKIALVIILSLFSLILLQTMTIRFLFGPKRFPAMTRIGIDHAQHMVDTIGQPPNLAKAAALHEQLGIQIRIENESISWVSNPDMIGFDDVSLVPVSDQPGTYAEFTAHGFCIEINRLNTRYLLVLHPKQENIRSVGYTFLFFLLFYLALILSLLYFVLKWLLRDVNVLAEGMQRIGSGDLDHRMTTGRRDELGQLVGSFNAMSERIQEMIHSRERLLLDVSHELRSPLTRIKLALEFMDDGPTKSAIHDDVREVETMVSELLEAERLSSVHGGLKRERCSLETLLSDLVREFASRRPGVRLRPSPSPVQCQIDIERIRVALRNIIDNALRFSHEDSQPVDISVQTSGDDIQIRIEDKGLGIPEKDLPYLFEPFYRVDRSRSKETGGYGLGLNLVQKIVVAHGGHIEVESRLGKGSTFIIHLPRLI